jgi:hypothetical protein
MMEQAVQFQKRKSVNASLLGRFPLSKVHKMHPCIVCLFKIFHQVSKSSFSFGSRVIHRGGLLREYGLRMAVNLMQSGLSKKVALYSSQGRCEEIIILCFKDNKLLQFLQSSLIEPF